MSLIQLDIVVVAMTHVTPLVILIHGCDSSGCGSSDDRRLRRFKPVELSEKERVEMLKDKVSECASRLEKQYQDVFHSFITESFRYDDFEGKTFYSLIPNAKNNSIKIGESIYPLESVYFKGSPKFKKMTKINAYDWETDKLIGPVKYSGGVLTLSIFVRAYIKSAVSYAGINLDSKLLSKLNDRNNEHKTITCKEYLDYIIPVFDAFEKAASKY